MATLLNLAEDLLLVGSAFRDGKPMLEKSVRADRG